MTDFMDGVLQMTILALFVALLIIAVASSADRASCITTAKVLGFTPYYSMRTGCILEKPNGTRVLLDQIRNVGISKE